MKITIRQGSIADLDPLIAMDKHAAVDPRRVDLIRSTVSAGTCFVATIDDRIVGYAAMSYSFYDNGMVNVLMVQKQNRRQGVGAALLNHLIKKCNTPKLFTSTNLSNKPMQALLAAQGFTITGFIDNLDEGDPELVYFKRLADTKPDTTEP